MHDRAPADGPRGGDGGRRRGRDDRLELLLGASTASGTRTWNEFLYNSGGNVDILYLTGAQNNFTSIANMPVGPAKVPVDGDVIRATRIGNVLRFYMNGVLVAGYDGSNAARVAKGSPSVVSERRR